MCRAVTQKPLSFFMSLEDTLTKIMNRQDGADKENHGSEPIPLMEYRDEEERRYIRLFELVTHLKTADKEFQLKNLVLVSFFLHLLQTCGYLTPSETDLHHRKFLGRVLFHLLAVSKFNTHQTALFETFSLGWENIIFIFLTCQN